MTEHFPSLIAAPADKALATSSVEPKSITVTSPYSAEAIATVETSNAAQLEQALATAHALFRDKANWLPLQQRIEILEKTALIMQERCEALAQAAAQEGGKPLIDSRVEVKRAIAGVKLCIDTIQHEAGTLVPMSETQANTSRIAFTQKEPIGVVVAVSAFNHPLNLIVHQVGAGIAAGCPVIVKPAEDTPLSCFRFVRILHEAGLPDVWCQALLTESLELATRLVSDPRVGFFSFIGSARVGWSLRSQLAPGTRCALEHGGVAPLIVDKSASLTKLIPAILKGGYYHAGQVCVSVQRVFVHSSQLDEVSERLKTGVEQLKVGDPLDPATEVGPLIREAELNRVHAWVDEAVKGGASLITGGEKLDNNCYAPTLLVNPPLESKLSTQEVFGPVVCVYSYDELEDAIAQANSLDVAFQASIYTQDIDQAIDIFHKLDASAIMLNDHTAFRQDNMPFAGLRQSGLGIGGIRYSIADMQIEKMMVIKSSLV